MDKVRTAFIGVGYRGKQLFRLLQNIPFFQVQAVADPGVKSSEISGIPCYNQGEDACLDMLKEHHRLSLAIPCAACLAMCGARVPRGVGD